jgi:Flp pilus assembly protein TadD
MFGIFNYFSHHFQVIFLIAVVISVIGLSIIGNRFARSEKYLRTLVRLSPKSAKAHFNLGSLLTEKSGRNVDAENEFSQAIELDPKLFCAYNDLASLLF